MAEWILTDEGWQRRARTAKRIVPMVSDDRLGSNWRTWSKPRARGQFFGETMRVNGVR
jgi:hypothetical protein